MRGLPRFVRHGGNAAEYEERDASHRDAKMPGYKRVAKLMGDDRAKEQTASDGADQPICGCCQTWTLKRKDDDG